MNSLGLTERLWQFTVHGKKRTFLGMAMVVSSAIALTMLPNIIGKAVDIVEYVANHDLDFADLMELMMPYFVSTVVILIFWYIFNTKGKAIINRNVSSARIRAAVTQKINRISTERVELHTSEDHSTIIVNDVPNVHVMMIEDIPCLVEQVMILLSLIILQLLTAWNLALVYIALVICAFLISRWIGRKNNSDMVERQRSMGELNDYLGDSISSHSLIKLYNLEDRFVKRFAEISNVNGASYVRTFRAAGFIPPLGRIIDNLGYILVAIFGASLVARGLLTPGTFVAFVSLATLMGKPIMELSEVINRLQNEAVSARRMFLLMDEAEAPDDSELDYVDPETVQGVVEFRDVHYRYPDGMEAIRGMTFRLDPGMLTVVVGVNGSGRNTTVDLLMRYRHPTEGQILLDGKDIGTIRRDCLWRILGTSPQHPMVTKGTVLDNIAYGCPESERIDVINTAKRTGYDDMVRGYPKGYDTEVGRKKYLLSSGEIQVMSFTRLMLYDPKVMILNESASDLDPVTMHRFASNYLDMIRGKTTLLISNDAEMASFADKVIFLEHGKVADTGTHEELMERNENYRAIFV